MDQRQRFETRKQFFGVAAHLMRMILVDHARAHRAAKRGGGMARLPLESAAVFREASGADLLALDEALERLSAVDERKGRSIELRYFAGMSAEEIADLAGVSVATIRRELRFAENWLCRQLKTK